MLHNIIVNNCVFTGSFYVKMTKNSESNSVNLFWLTQHLVCVLAPSDSSIPGYCEQISVPVKI